MSSCSKDELIPINRESTNKVIEIKKEGKVPLMKIKFNIFRKKKYKVPKS